MDRRKRFCSRPCKDRAKDAARQAVIEAAKPERQCIHCGADMPRSMRADARFCSEDCNSAAHNLKRGNGRLGPGRRREIERAYIIERDGSRCHLCGKKCKPEEIHLDHLIPLSRGGTHAYENVRVAHAFCNLSKRDQPRNEQLLLIG
jgi:predicted nucleic acid-binding Zn ribbon protein